MDGGKEAVELAIVGYFYFPGLGFYKLVLSSSRRLDIDLIPIIDVCVCDHIVGHLDVCVHVVIVVIIVVTEDRKWKHFKIVFNP